MGELSSVKATQMLPNLLFLKIATVAQYPSWQNLSPSWQEAWEKKAMFLGENPDPEALYLQKAGIYAEFGRVLAISMGFFHQNKKQALEFRSKTFIESDEKKLLSQWVEVLEKFSKKTILVGFHSKEFDVPFLCRRFIVNRLELPELLDISGKKPWQIPHIDLLELWKFGDHKHFTALNTLAMLLDIPIPPSLPEGHEISNLYYSTNDLDKIKHYCDDKNRLAAQIYLRLNLLDPENSIG